MKSLLDDLKAFHAACDVPILSEPQWPAPERIGLRLNLLKEEVQELRMACENRDMVEAADAIADIIYVAVGTALEFGIPIDRVWAEVQRSNMAKVDPATGKVCRRDDGKILKPAGWTPPDVAAALTAGKCDR